MREIEMIIAPDILLETYKDNEACVRKNCMSEFTTTVRYLKKNNLFNAFVIFIWHNNGIFFSIRNVGGGDVKSCLETGRVGWLWV